MSAFARERINYRCRHGSAKSKKKLPVQAPHSPAPQSDLAPLPGDGSLAQLRLRRIFSPVPATHSSSNGAAVYIGFPLSDHPTCRNFFEPAIPVSSRTPLLSDLLGALRSANTPVSQVLNHICAGLDGTPFHIAWSKLMLEVHEPGYCAVSNGYREIGLLCLNPVELTRLSERLVQGGGNQLN
ncbi:hypothetical protein B0H14DRAFT_2587282 [Mycena olivaceomarginata]|nr:hypothetical protein B0H14DRAFT_2587282 [Mycena olivaceomarginata]